MRVCRNRSTSPRETLQVPIRYNRYLIDVLAAHQLKRLDRRCLRRNCPQLSKRAHHALHAGLRPSVPIDTLHFMRRNQSDQVIVLHDDEAGVLCATAWMPPENKEAWSDYQ